MAPAVPMYTIVAGARRNEGRVGDIPGRLGGRSDSLSKPFANPVGTDRRLRRTEAARDGLALVLPNLWATGRVRFSSLLFA